MKSRQGEVQVPVESHRPLLSLCQMFIGDNLAASTQSLGTQHIPSSAEKLGQEGVSIGLGHPSHERA